MAQDYGHVVGQELQWNDVGDGGCERWKGVRYFYHIVGQVSDLLVSLFDDRDYSCSTSLHLHDVTNYLLVSLVLRCNEYYWESFFDECDESVLTLACRVRHRWDVA